MVHLIDTTAVNFQQQFSTPKLALGKSTDCFIEYLQEKKPNLSAIIYNNPDGAGHSKGWSTPEYMDMLGQLDGCIKRIIEAVEEAGMMDETVIMVVADHGGLGTKHGGKTMNEMQTPWVIYGKGIKKGHQLKESIMIYDIAGTLAYLLNVKQPQAWIARPILSILED